MATKKSTQENNDKPGIVKVAEKIAFIAGTIVGKKNQLVRKGGETIETVKSKLHDLTGTKKTAAKKVKKSVKKAGVTVKNATNKVAKKAAAKAGAAKKKVKSVVRKAKKAAKKATR